jgi:hypothetical protein
MASIYFIIDTKAICTVFFFWAWAYQSGLPLSVHLLKEKVCHSLSLIYFHLLLVVLFHSAAAGHKCVIRWLNHFVGRIQVGLDGHIFRFIFIFSYIHVGPSLLCVHIHNATTSHLVCTSAAIMTGRATQRRVGRSQCVGRLRLLMAKSDGS